MKKSIESVRPILAIEKDIFLSRIGAYSLGFKLSLKPVFSMTEIDYERCADEFSRIINILPDNSILHKMDVFFKTKTTPKFTNDKGISFMKEAYVKKFFERDHIQHESYIFISKTTEANMNKTSLTSLILKKNFIIKDFLDETIKEEFFKGVAQAETLFNESIYFNVERLKADEFINLCRRYENLSFGNDLNFSSDIKQDKKSLKIGSNNLSCIALNTLNSLPLEFEDIYIDSSYQTSKSSLKFSNYFPIGLGLKENHIVNQVFVKEPVASVKKNIQNFKKESTMFSFGDSGNVQNTEDLDGFNHHLDKGFSAIRYHSNVLLWDRNEEKLGKIENDVIAAFNKIKLLPNITYGDTLPIYWSCYPGNIADLGVKDQTFYLLDRQATALNIYETNSKESSSDFGIKLSERLTGVPIHVDISDEPIKKGLTNNRNKMIFGPSGSGKSFLTNVMLNGYLQQGAHIVAVDVGDSYERLCQLYKGTYLRYTEESPISFNPFNAPKEQRTIEKKESLITLIFTLWKKNPDENTRDEYKILSDSINKYYDYMEDKELHLSFNSYFDFMQTTFKKELTDKDLINHFDYMSFFNVLSMFYKGGEYDYLLNSEENSDLLNEQFIVFELDNIKDHPILFPVVTLMIMETFISKMRLLKNTRKVILLEEAWKAITKAGMAEFMKYLYKTVRKYFGEAILVTQEVDDIIGNPIIKDTILKNCGAKILLDMREYAEAFEPIQRMLGLNQSAVEQILSLNQNNIPGDKYKEVFIGLGNEGNVYGVNVSKEEYACYTTEKLEKEKIEALYEKHQDIELAIKLYAETL